MFDFVQKNQLFIKVLLGGIALTFAGFGVSSYNNVSDSTVASVDGAKIDLQELEKSLQSQNATPEQKQQALQSLIFKKMLDNQAGNLRLTATDEALRKSIAEIPAFQKNGRFDQGQYTLVLANNNLTAETFEADMRSRLAVDHLLAPLASTGIVGKAQVERIVQLMTEQRDVAAWAFLPSAYLAAAKVSDADIKQYYDQHKTAFNVPERVKVDYLVLSPETLAPAIAVKPEDVQAYYDKNKAKYLNEERKLSHILVSVAANAKPDVVAAAKAKAEKLLAEVKAKPAAFAEIAKKSSDDTGSAEQGGDLGFVTQDKMVKPFADAAFALQKGQISDVVRSEFGFHIIQVNDIKPGDEAVAKSKVEADLKQKEAVAKLARDGEVFKNLVNEQAKSLQPAAAKFGLTVKQSDWLDKTQAADAALNSAEVRDAIFQSDVLKKGYNTEVVEQSGGVLVAARVTAHENARTKPLAEVTAQVRDILVKQAAIKLAKQAAATQLALLQAGKPVTAAWTPVQQVSRGDGKGLDANALRAIFRTAPVAGKAAYATTDLPEGGSVIFQINKSAAPVVLDAKQKAMLIQQLTQASVQGEVMAYQKWLQAETPVKIYPKALGVDAQQ
ncbi:SurA N-terminal domain-containing protein [Leeia oryzae]|uniref:SurA N-terminal domain-containing protein n=1 Tax=Leeia oryzae TaxID=356662 RepID=UPI00037877C6|nr:SurA N-terminal domain-containing protein [Leeia oryzae]